MIQRVYEQVKGCTSLAEVVVATDDQRIEEHVRSFAGNVIMTSSKHESGTDRCAEVVSKINGFDVAINIQGDEPFINPLQIDLLCSLFNDPKTDIGTLIKKIDKQEDLFSENTPKVIVGSEQQALYFSRQTIPFLRGIPNTEWLRQHTFYKHIGVYGYKTAVLQEITQLPISSLEKAEALEQLRWLENGYRIRVAETAYDTVAVDRPEDLETIKRTFF